VRAARWNDDGQVVDRREPRMSALAHVVNGGARGRLGRGTSAAGPTWDACCAGVREVKMLNGRVLLFWIVALL
jgi:hypothetical protein